MAIFDEENAPTNASLNPHISISAHQQVSTVKLFPVPTTGSLNVEYIAAQEGDIQIQIVDASGRMMYAQKANVLKGTNTLNMDLFDLPGGLFYMTIRDGSGHIQTKPFTKLSP